MALLIKVRTNSLVLTNVKFVPTSEEKALKTLSLIFSKQFIFKSVRNLFPRLREPICSVCRYVRCTIDCAVYRIFFPRYLVGSSKNKMSGLSINSSAMERRLHSPPDKQEIRVRRQFKRPSVCITPLICQIKSVVSTVMFIHCTQRLKHLQWIFFPCMRHYCLA